MGRRIGEDEEEEMDAESREIESTEREIRVTAWRSWSPDQFVAGVMGLVFTVMGGVALARLLPTSSLTGETTTVLGVGHTPLMAIITLGLLYLAEAGSALRRPAGDDLSWGDGPRLRSHRGHRARSI